MSKHDDPGLGTKTFFIAFGGAFVVLALSMLAFDAVAPGFTRWLAAVPAFVYIAIVLEVSRRRRDKSP